MTILFLGVLVLAVIMPHPALGDCTGEKCAAEKVAIVTGSNRGIGLEVVSGLLSKLDEPFIVYLTSRKPLSGALAMNCLLERHFAQGRGNTCCKGINAGSQPCRAGSQYYSGSQGHAASRIVYQELDLASEESIKAFVDHIADTHGRVDILVNNACAAGRAKPREHIEVDIHGHLQLLQGLAPMVQDNARIVMVASMSGSLDYGYSTQRQAQLRSEELTLTELRDLMDSFVTASEAGSAASVGFPSYGYSVAKAGTIAMARVLSRQPLWNASGVTINACCPGMANAPLCQKGAHTIIQLATLPVAGDAPNGRFFQDPGFSGTIKETVW